MNLPMIPIMANRSSVSSVDSFMVFPSGSLEVRASKPKSPVTAMVLGDWSGESSQKAQ